MGYFNITIQSTVAVNGIKLPLKENCVPELETITSTPDPDPGPPPPSKMSEQKLLKLWNNYISSEQCKSNIEIEYKTMVIINISTMVQNKGLYMKSPNFLCEDCKK